MQFAGEGAGSEPVETPVHPTKQAGHRHAGPAEAWTFGA
jgi:hypothetical protein